MWVCCKKKAGINSCITVQTVCVCVCFSKNLKIIGDCDSQSRNFQSIVCTLVENVDANGLVPTDDRHITSDSWSLSLQVILHPNISGSDTKSGFRLEGYLPLAILTLYVYVCVYIASSPLLEPRKPELGW